MFLSNPWPRRLAPVSKLGKARALPAARRRWWGARIPHVAIALALAVASAAAPARQALLPAAAGGPLSAIGHWLENLSKHPPIEIPRPPLHEVPHVPVARPYELAIDPAGHEAAREAAAAGIAAAGAGAEEYGANQVVARRARADAMLRPHAGVPAQGDRVYVEFAQGRAYYRANFALRGTSAVQQTGSLRNEVVADPSAVSRVARVFPQADAERVPNAEIQVLLDVSVFDNEGVPRVDLTGANNIRLVDGRRNAVLEGAPELMLTSEPPPSLVAKVMGCCLYARPPHWAAKFSKVLAQRRFDARKAKVISLFIDTSTEQEMARSKQITKARIGGDAGQLKSAADLERAFMSAQGTTVVLLAHVEGRDYVMRTSANAVQLRVPIERVRAMARAADVNLIDIGCETTRAIAVKSFGFGIMGRYNTVDTVKALEHALDSSRTQQDFLVKLSSNGLKIVLEPSFLQPRAQSASVYERVREGWVRVAQVTFSWMK